ncbi:hypothetical protein MTO96_026073, partial [Rhipicephalus appendiculatus]
LTETLESLQRSTDQERLSAGLEELKTSITDLCSEPLSTVQSRVTELVVLLEKHDASKKQEIAHALEFSDEMKKKFDILFKDMTSALRDSESKIKEDVSKVEASIFSRLTSTLQSLQNRIDSQQLSAGLQEANALARQRRSDPLSRIQSRNLDAQLRQLPKTVSDLEHYRGKLAKTVDTLENKVDALRGSERELKEQVDRVVGDLSSRLENTLKFLQSTANSQQLSAEQGERNELLRHQRSDPLSRIESRKLDEQLRRLPKTLSDLEHYKCKLAKTVETLEKKADALKGCERELKEQVHRVVGDLSSRLENTAQSLQRSIDSWHLNDQSSQCSQMERASIVIS